MNDSLRDPSRRGFITVAATATGGLWLSFAGCSPPAPPDGAATPPPLAGRVPPHAERQGALDGWIRIDPDNAVQLTIAEAEMGQGVLTALAMVLADELDVDWSTVSVFHAPANEAVYGRQSTGGSTSVRRGFGTMRQVGATARELLRAAGAARFGVPLDQVRAAGGMVRGGGQEATYGALAAEAATLKAPANVPLRPVNELRYVGQPLPRLDLPEKVDGSAVFGIDVSVPGMVYASIERCPLFGGELDTVDDAAAREVPGVIDVVTVPSGVAVVARHTWAAFQGRRALQVTWKGDTSLDTAAVRARCTEALPKGKVARDDGDVEAALGADALDVVYEAPYLAHTAMEPLNCTVAIQDDGIDVWVGTQTPTGTVKRVAQITGRPESAIRVHTAMLGGGFGRRSQTDFVADAVWVAKAIGKPVKVTWTREDDVRAGWYRPFVLSRLRGSMSKDGTITAWWHQIAASHINGYEPATLEGAENVPYAIENCRVSAADPQLPVSVWWWRSVGSSQNAWFTECFFDELCRRASRDPIATRRALLAGQPRHLAVLDAALDRAKGDLPEGRARGVAVHACFGSIAAMVAEVSVQDGIPRVHHVVCAVDCGQVVNPDTVVAQMESGIVYGLTAVLHGAIDLQKGRAVPGNFHDYRALTIDETPTIETVLVPNGSDHGGIGEPGTPPLAPAVCNAMLALTGEPVRKLPIRPA